MNIKLTHNILNDKYTEYVYEAFDIQNKEKSIVNIEANLENLPKEWQIGVVYGGSGTGKTTILKEYFKRDVLRPNFSNDKSLISNFQWLSPKEAAMLLSAMGLATVPTWLRPYHTLSNGEKYRAYLAYVVSKTENQVILVDEYTSVVDRDVAKAMSNALQKYIRRNNKQIVLASCHFDIMDWLQPDWIYSPEKGRLEIAPRRRQRPEIKLQIFRCRYETWKIFKKHHYLTEELNKAAKSFVITFNDKPVCFIAILPMPSGTIKNAFRVSRLVVMPDFQGLGIGMKTLNIFGSMYKADNKTLYIKTSNPSLFIGMSRNMSYWSLIGETNNIEKIKKNNQKIIEQGKDNGIKLIKESITKSYKYIGESHNENIDVLKFDANVYKDVSQSQISLF